MSWNNEMEPYSLEVKGETQKGWWFNDGTQDDNFFLPESCINILEREKEVWLVEIPNWLAKQKGLI
jgi:hypothetical protein